MEETSNRRNWLRIFSPAVLGILFSIISILFSYADLEASGGWSFIAVIALAPVVIILLFADVIIKLVFYKKTLVIWIVELLVLSLVYLLWISRFS